MSAGPTDRGAGADDGGGRSLEFTDLDQEALALRGRALGACLQAGDSVLLHGPMGAGKTTLTRAIAVGLGVSHPGRVQSPTFTLCMVHHGRGPSLVHVDLFRLGGDGDEGLGGGAGFDSLDLEELLLEAGAFGEAAEQPSLSRGAAMIVEWGSRWRTPPADHLAITLTRPSVDRRSLFAAATGPVRPRCCPHGRSPARASPPLKEGKARSQETWPASNTAVGADAIFWASRAVTRASGRSDLCSHIDMRRADVEQFGGRGGA
ncbi:tRNA (adenosine(37)-N6)-threonylcarbamoyltransferase complex ATPase subunit type 1 TsaE [Nannocystis pusilla]|uniref:tRNA (adenosine(37)-N6)-threonylcarbamoyltransferase complex ATPase subunit type 1 TsaE n=1 Tax=Nannocystis pusilla TaxID=889268 RepID=UPI003B798653